ncbi:Nn.00g001520.m01.CDS01 [Neocucurbitaria sp. VM-36]
MAPPTDTDPTLYPKITNHVSEIVQNLQHLNRDPENPEGEVVLDQVPLVGTIKLHGTHADIVIYNDDRIVFQSRNVTGLSAAKDNQGFATAMSKKSKTLLRLRDLYLSRWTQLNPNATVDASRPVLIAGEWIGENVQKGVAIAQLSKRFVIISVNINGQWQNDTSFSGISLPNHDIYNISRAGLFNATLYPQDIQRTLAEVEPLAEAVANRCPFAETFGVEGEGEGLVWKLAPHQYNSNPTLWFKTKGGRFKPTFARPPKKIKSFDTVEEQRREAASLVQVWCSEQRLEQGWDVMREKGIERNLRGLSDFLKWVQHDVLVEEKGYIQQYKVDESGLKISIARIAKPWYLGRLQSGIK